MPIAITSGAISNNVFGLLKSKALLPRFRIDLEQSKAILQGQSTSFVVLAVGDPTPTYQWYFNNTIIEGETSPTLSNVSAAGVYKVIATNSRGSVTSTLCTLTVSNGAPIILIQPVDAYISKGETAEFYVLAEGLGALNYEWYQNGELMSPSAPNMATLYIHNTEADAYTRDNYKYKCKVYNQLGEVFTVEVTLRFKGLAPVIVYVTPDFDIYEGNKAELFIVAEGYPEPSIEWYLPYGVYNTPFVDFYPTSPDFSYGDNFINYRAVNRFGEVGGTVKMTLRKAVPPTVTTAFPQRISVTVDPEKSNFAELNGEVEGDPPIALDFKRNSSTGPTIGTSSGNTTSVSIPVTPDSGSFTPPPPSNSSASSSYSPPSSSSWSDWGYDWPYDWVTIFLIIPGGTWNNLPYSKPGLTDPIEVTATITKPILVGQPPEYVIGYIGETRYFNAAVNSKDGQLGLNYEWLSNEDYVLNHTPSFAWNISSISENNKKFACKIYNTAGAVYTRISTLKVLSATPIITAQPADQIVTNSSFGCVTATMSVTVYQPGAPVADTAMSYVWYVNEQPYNPITSNTNTLLFSSCDCFYDKNFFNVKVVVKNLTTGNETTSATAKIELRDPATILTQPNDIIASVGTNAEFFVDVCRKDNYIYRWYSKNRSGAISAISGANTSALSVYVSSVALNGYEYFCEISLPDGTSVVTSRLALLTIDQY
jgi:hypothetical protein